MTAPAFLVPLAGQPASWARTFPEALRPAHRTLRGEMHEASVATADVAFSALEQLYFAQYDKLVRLSALLLHDVTAAEEVVQDAFVAVHDAWSRLRNPEAALGYLRHTVLNRSRTAVRRQRTAASLLPRPSASSAEDAQGADVRVLAALEQQSVIDALRCLPARQREALVLRYYGELSEAEIAHAMGVSRGSVKVHVSRGMAALRTALGDL